jgi:hypothetical protein
MRRKLASKDIAGCLTMGSGQTLVYAQAARGRRSALEEQGPADPPAAALRSALEPLRRGHGRDRDGVCPIHPLVGPHLFTAAPGRTNDALAQWNFGKGQDSMVEAARAVVAEYSADAVAVCAFDAPAGAPDVTTHAADGSFACPVLQPLVAHPAGSLIATRRGISRNEDTALLGPACARLLTIGTALREAAR